MLKSAPKGFTLIELLVVIGILAILTAAVVIVLNPAELLKQSRDAQRFSDFSALQSAISLYLSSATTPVFKASGPLATAGNCLALTYVGSCTTNATTSIDGSGWVAVNFNELTSVGLNSPVSVLPTDPVNNASYDYAFKADLTNNYYVLNTVLESTKYSGKASTDGGASSTVYEVGNRPGLSW